MKTLGKQILQAFLLGAVLPGTLLGLSVGIIPEQEYKPEIIPGTTASVEDTEAAQSDRITIPVLDENGNISLWNLEDYLCGVVMAEMPADFETEALKAQAVVARTYALRRNSISQKHPQGAVCTQSSCCQGYLSEEAFLNQGGDHSSIEKIGNAVQETAGQVLTYDGVLIEATYFSCSGGVTEDAAAVWGGDVPYLQSVESPGEEYATHYTDTVILTPEEVEEKLGITLGESPDAWFQVVSYTDAGSVEEMKAGDRIFTGVQLRSLLNLRSTDFTVDADWNKITIVTHGFGHRVGLSQYGADAMAASGSTYEEILAHYYQGTELTAYSDD